eukprot:1147747-Pelagomonas_calceolata.AAC.5
MIHGAARAAGMRVSEGEMPGVRRGMPHARCEKERQSGEKAVRRAFRRRNACGVGSMPPCPCTMSRFSFCSGDIF